MKLFGSAKSKITKDKNGENVPHLEITEQYQYIISNDYQQDLRFLYTFVPNKSFGHLLDIHLKSLYFLKTSDSKFSHIKAQFTNQNSKPLEIDNEINQSVKYKK